MLSTDRQTDHPEHILGDLVEIFFKMVCLLIVRHDWKHLAIQISEARRESDYGVKKHMTIILFQLDPQNRTFWNQRQELGQFQSFHFLFEYNTAFHLDCRFSHSIMRRRSCQAVFGGLRFGWYWKLFENHNQKGVVCNRVQNREAKQKREIYIPLACRSLNSNSPSPFWEYFVYVGAMLMSVRFGK